MKIQVFSKSFISSLIMFSLMFFLPGFVFSAPGSGAIWTTTGSCGDPQNVNSYGVGDVVFINGSDFDAGTYDWQIEGQPGGASGDPNIVVASGSQAVDSSGDFCFSAYTVAEDDWGEYTVDFGRKNDNYNVDRVFATATPVPTSTVLPTATPTPEPSSSPTDSPTLTPTPTPSSTPVPTAGPTEAPQGTQTSTTTQSSNSGNSGQVLGTSTSSTGQVLGASTVLGAAGDDFHLMIFTFILGGVAVSGGVGDVVFIKE